MHTEEHFSSFASEHTEEPPEALSQDAEGHAVMKTFFQENRVPDVKRVAGALATATRSTRAPSPSLR